MAKQQLEKLKAKLRDDSGTRAARRLRKTGMVPATVYGHKQDPISIALLRDDLTASVRNRSRMVELVIGRKKEQALLKDIQYDALGSDIIHADFERVALDQKVRLQVPVELKGHPKGASEGGILEHILANVEIECLATDIPELLVADVRELEIDDHLTVGDLAVPDGVQIIADPGTLVAVVGRPKVYEELGLEAVEEGAAAAEPEVIGRVAEDEKEGEEAEQKKSDTTPKQG